MSSTSPPGEQPEPRFRGFPPLSDPSPRYVERPWTVFAGTVMAGVGGVVGLVLGLFLLSMSTSSTALAPVAVEDRADLVRGIHLVGAISSIWCPIVVVAAVFAFRGARWAALTLVAMAGIYGLVSVAASVLNSTAQGGIGLIWALVSAALVYGSQGARAWFRAG